MDSLVSAAARALASGDALGALKRVALREDPPALALRGIAMAQLGEHPRARELLQRAARGFGAREPLARARCAVAEAEIALAVRDLERAPRALDAAEVVLRAHGDYPNAAHARLIAARRLLLLGRLEEARRELVSLDDAMLPPALAATAQLVAAELSMRAVRTRPAGAALAQAHAAALRARIPALVAEVEAAQAIMGQPAARRIIAGGEQALRLAEVEALVESGALIVDGCRVGVRKLDAWLALARRPVLFVLARTLAAAWPGDAERDALIGAAFRLRRVDDTHRARLRVELGRLRTLLQPWARVDATARGYALVPHDDRGVVVLAPPIDGAQATLLALLSDGEAWSTSSLALALDTSQRSVQRALAELESAGRVRAIGRARARRWLAAPLGGFATTLLLPDVQPPA